MEQSNVFLQDERGLNASDIARAARAWRNGMNTAEIAEVLTRPDGHYAMRIVTEADVYNRIEIIKSASAN